MKKLNLAIKIAIPVVGLILFMGTLWLMGGTAKAEVQSLQESVEMAQADYDLTQLQAKDAMFQACSSWKDLALAKASLATAMKIPSALNQEIVKAVNCETAKDVIPASF